MHHTSASITRLGNANWASRHLGTLRLEYFCLHIWVVIFLLVYSRTSIVDNERNEGRRREVVQWGGSSDRRTG